MDLRGPRARTPGQGCCCPHGVPPSLPPAPPWMLREAEKRSRSALRVTEAAAAARARYCVSLERQSLCTEAKTQGMGETSRGTHSCEAPLWSPQVSGHPGSSHREGGDHWELRPQPQSCSGGRGVQGTQGTPEGPARDQDPEQPLRACGSWGRDKSSIFRHGGSGRQRRCWEGTAKGL